MKRFSIFLMSVLLSLTSFAQETGCHLDFEGIPVTGTLNEFLTISESKGYKLLERNEQSMLYDCDFQANALELYNFIYQG